MEFRSFDRQYSVGDLSLRILRNCEKPHPTSLSLADRSRKWTTNEYNTTTRLARARFCRALRSRNWFLNQYIALSWSQDIITPEVFHVYIIYVLYPMVLQMSMSNVLCICKKTINAENGMHLYYFDEIYDIYQKATLPLRNKIRIR